MRHTVASEVRSARACLNWRALVAGLFFVNALVSVRELSAADLELFWVVQISLDSPDIDPPAVQWTILDHDPVPEYRAMVKRMRALDEKRMKEAGSESRARAQRSAAMSVYWNNAFKSVTGDRVHLLTPGSHAISSDGEDGPRWIITKTVSIHGDPVCWYIPVETAKGTTVDVKLTPKNRFDLLDAFESVLEGKGGEKR
jgi:hypothetical protein